MKPNLKPLDQQVVVLTGATSGIGLATARRLAERDASLFLIARNEDVLRELAEEIKGKGGRAEFMVVDVADREAVSRAAATAVERFGRIDTWINDAGVSIYGKLWEVPLEDSRRLFETNFWGVVNGSLTALEHLRTNGGALITVASVLADFSIPEQGYYCASKHAIKGFSNSLRQEVMGAKLPVAVTLIKPSAIATPFPSHAVNYMDKPGKLPPPVYAPELVADAIVHACEHHVRELTVGSAGKAQTLFYNWAPGLADPIIGALGGKMQKTDKSPGGIDNLHHAGSDGEVRGEDKFVRKTSLFLEAQKRPGLAVAVTGGLTVAAMAAIAIDGAVKNELRVRRRIRKFKERRGHTLHGPRLFG